MNNDLISREALRNVILNDRKLDGANANWEVNRILVHIDNAPTVTAFTKDDMAGAYNEGYYCGNRENKRPKGEWIEKQDNKGGWWECNKCGKEPLRNFDVGLTMALSNFCPNCGAEMRKKEGDNK